MLNVLNITLFLTLFKIKILIILRLSFWYDCHLSEDNAGSEVVRK